MTAEATFPLIEDSVTTPSVPGLGVPLLVDVDLRAGYGYGITTPFRRDARNDFASAGGDALLSSLIQQVLGTRADNDRMMGELPWRTNFGSLVYTLQYLGIDEVFPSLVRNAIVRALATWLPEVQVTKCPVSRERDANGNLAAIVRITYNVVQPGTQTMLASNQETSLTVPLNA